MIYDELGQKLRQEKINNAFINYNKKELLSCDLSKWENFGLKERTWILFCLANYELEFSEVMNGLFDNNAELNDFHTFLSFMFISLIYQNESNIPVDIVKLMKKHIIENIPQSMTSNWNFIGVNDNTPAMIAAALILAGEYFDMSDWTECGYKRLISFEEELKRREFVSEFNSPTYLPISICAMALIGEYSKKYKKMGLRLEKLLWKQLFRTVYLQVSNLAGPFGRAYERDKLCQTHNIRMLLYLVLGDLVTITPLNTIFDEAFIVENHERIYLQMDAVWICNYAYHCPNEFVEKLLQRDYPVKVKGTAEMSSSFDTYLIEPIKGNSLGDYTQRKANLERTDILSVLDTDDCFEYQCTVADIYSYICEKYALGTSTHAFHSGIQTDSFTLLYTKDGKIAHKQTEIGTVYCNYCINSGISLRNDYGQKVAFQKDNHAMILYSPVSTQTKIKELKLDIYFSNYEEMIKGIYIDDKCIDVSIFRDGNKLKTKLQGIFFNMGTIYCHLKPVVNKKDIEDAFVEIKAESGFLVVSIYNYKNDEKEFKKKDIRSKTNGFVFDVEDSDDLSFEEFCDFYNKAVIADNVICNPHTRYTMMREVIYKCGNVKLACCISPVTNGIRYISTK